MGLFSIKLRKWGLFIEGFKQGCGVVAAIPGLWGGRGLAGAGAGRGGQGAWAGSVVSVGPAAWGICFDSLRALPLLLSQFSPHRQLFLPLWLL